MMMFWISGELAFALNDSHKRLYVFYCDNNNNHINNIERRLESIGWKNGVMLKVSTPTGFWSAMMHVYKKHDIEVPDSTYNQWIQYRKGFKNVRAKRVEEGNRMQKLLLHLFCFAI